MKNNRLDHFAQRIKTALLKDKRRITISKHIFVLTLYSLFLTPVNAQQDSALNRSVTVERDFQPVIQSAGKISTKPAVVETVIEPAPVEYSTYTASLTPEGSVHPMLSQPTRFMPGKPFNGYVRGGLGHPQTLFDFGYHLDDSKRSILDVYAHHKGDWCHALMLSKTKVGLDFTHTFATCDLYFGVNGGNIYYHRYGDLYSSSLPKNSTTLWTAEVYMGVKANARQEVQYLFQTGYALFTKPGAVSEHQIRTKGFFDWHTDIHHIGANLYVQNNFMQLGSLADVIAPSQYNSRHNIRLEPYYALEGRRVQLHVGVNLDMNIGCGKMLSGSDNISFAPSPHVHFEAQLAKQWMTLYADVTGFHGFGNLQEFMETNRYRYIQAGITEHHPAAYTPVDAELGFHIRPYRDLMIELHGGFARLNNQEVLLADGTGNFDFLYTDYNRGKVGGQINYHYRDIVRVNFNGDYFIWGGKTPVYDRAAWELGLRIDGRIDKHWSLFSDNRFSGSRKALAWDAATNAYTEHTLKPMIDLDLGAQYEMWVGKSKNAGGLKVNADGTQVLAPEPQPNLVLFAQLENFIHRKNEIYYGFHHHGIGFLIGATFRF
ncbi:MAG: hypothetical protein IJ249_03560 [Paludibacteraceae bacterium]|nr:hypothetical protein [Paludibacteraceae bacterium]